MWSSIQTATLGHNRFELKYLSTYCRRLPCSGRGTAFKSRRPSICSDPPQRLARNYPISNPFRCPAWIRNRWRKSWKTAFLGSQTSESCPSQLFRSPVCDFPGSSDAGFRTVRNSTVCNTPSFQATFRRPHSDRNQARMTGKPRVPKPNPFRKEK